jgi:hypothetical protein
MSAMMNAHADLLYSDEGRFGTLLWLGGA